MNWYEEIVIGWMQEDFATGLGVGPLKRDARGRHIHTQLTELCSLAACALSRTLLAC